MAQTVEMPQEYLYNPGCRYHKNAEENFATVFFADLISCHKPTDRLKNVPCKQDYKHLVILLIDTFYNNKNTTPRPSTTARMNNGGAVQTWPRRVLQLEGLCIFGTSIWAYSRLGRSWWFFTGALLLPDLGMVGYLANTQLGAVVYNSLHTYTPPVLLLCAAVAGRKEDLLGGALCWLAHIGMDRMFGFGLKYGTGFGHTHLGQIGG